MIERFTIFGEPLIAEAAAAQGLAGRGEIILQGTIRAALAAEIATEVVSGNAAMHRLTGVLAAPTATEAPPPQAPDSDLIARFVPKEVAAYPVSGEFRHAVSLFIRFAQEPEAAEIESLIDKAFELQDRYGGMLNRLSFGDKGTNLLLFWGAPTSHENDIERALGYALDLRAEAGLEFSAGITYRIAHAGFVGGERREDYTCYSRGVNLAARLMMAAPMGAIWLDAPAAERARDAFELAQVGALSFKGFEDRQTVYALSGRRHNPAAALRWRPGRSPGRSCEVVRVCAAASRGVVSRVAGRLG